MIEIISANERHLPQMAALAASTQAREHGHVPQLAVAREEAFLPLLEARLSEGNAWVAQLEGIVCGYLLAGQGWDADGMQCFHVPVWASGTTETTGNLLPPLFAHGAERLVIDHPIRFEWDLPAHDDGLIRSISRLQFGIQYEEALRNTADPIPDAGRCQVREWEKTEIAARWNEIWQLLSLLIRHLQKSPVFYPGREFTEGIYRDFLMDAETRFFAVETEGRICGILEANRESRSPMTASNAWNVGEAYVLPALRRKGIAQALLAAVNDTLRREGISQLWVGHGTANPAACGFWNRYFTPYLVTMLREIHPI